MTVMEMSAMAVVDICSSVLAKRTAVPLTVAMASERRNYDIRNSTICFNCTAILMVFQRLFQAKEI